MSNPLIHVRNAPAVAQGLRDAADACTPNQSALKARLVTAAAMVEILVELLVAALAKQHGRNHRHAALTEASHDA